MPESVDLVNIRGLSEEEASLRLKKEGPNELASQKRRSIFSIFFHVIKEPMLLLLIASGLIYLFLGSLHDALMLLSFVFVVIGITFYQERKTDRALYALRNLSSPRALVIRGGEQRRIAGREVVRGDILILKEGDRVPADGRLLSCSNLSVDESLLTGESLPVRKTACVGTPRLERPGGDDLPFVYSGTLVVAGRGIAEVLSIGVQTEMGKIGRILQEVRQEDTLLQKETAKIVRNFAAAGIIFCISVVVVYGLTRGDWLNGLLSGLTLGMAMLPEEFPVVLIIFLTLGAWRISRSKVLTRRTPAIETLGAATVLCADKTGTLTTNSMRLETLFSKSEVFELDGGCTKPLPERFHDIMEFSILASQQDPFDPIEKEVRRVGSDCLSGTEHIHNNWKLIREYPLSKKLLALSHVWESPDKRRYIIAAKGAPEAIFDLCHMQDGPKKVLLEQIEQMAEKGQRVLGVAKASFEKTALPSEQHDFVFDFIGFLGFVDPVRPAVPQAIQEAYEAGIRVIMITGDYPGTAMHVARLIGLKNPDNTITGPELGRMDAAALKEKIRTVNIFSRVMPEQKLILVDALKSNGEIVAMTGDGVNDAPALKSAHIGIAMGERGTDVAREASALVLLNDDFSSIVQAVRLGRRIFDNLKKAISYIFAVHVPIAGMAFLPVLFKLPIVLLPAHIAFLELIIDPACSTVFESDPEEKYIMDRPPRNLCEPLFDRRAFLVSLLQGLSVLIVSFVVFLLALRLKKGELEARTLTFATLVFANLMLILTNLSWSQHIFKTARSKNNALRSVVFGTLVALLLVLYVPFLRRLFHFCLLGSSDVLIAFISGMVSLIWFEGLKMIPIRSRKR